MASDGQIAAEIRISQAAARPHISGAAAPLMASTLSRYSVPSGETMNWKARSRRRTPIV